MKSAQAQLLESPVYEARTAVPASRLPAHIRARAKDQLSRGRELAEMFDPARGEAMHEFSQTVFGQDDISLLELLRAGRQRSLAEYALQRAIDLSYELEDEALQQLDGYFGTLELRVQRSLEAQWHAARVELSDMFVVYREELAGLLWILRDRVRDLESEVQELWAVDQDVARRSPRAPGESDAALELRLMRAIERRVDLSRSRIFARQAPARHPDR